MASKKKTTTHRSKSDPEIRALARVTKHAQAILEEYETVGDEGAERIREYILARMGVVVSIARQAPLEQSS